MSQLQEKKYWLFEPGKPTRGPYTLHQLLGLEKNTKLSPKTHICLVGETAWKPLNSVLNISIPVNSTVANPLPLTNNIQEAGPPPIPLDSVPPPIPNGQKIVSIPIFFAAFGGVVLFLLVLVLLFKGDRDKPHDLNTLVKIKEEGLKNRQLLELKTLEHRRLWWELKSEVIEKTLLLLGEREAAKDLGGAGEAGLAAAEEKTRKYLTDRRGQALLEKAKTLLEQLPPHALEELRERTQEDQRMENLFLDWLTLEGLKDFGYLARIWQEQGKEPLHSSKEVAAFLKNASKPSLEKPIQVSPLTRKQGLQIQFGQLNFDEEYEITSASAKINSVFYNLAKLLGREGNDANQIQFQVESGQFNADFWKGLKSYLEKGHTQPWAFSLFKDSHQQACLALATGKVGDIPEKFAVKGDTKLPLKDLFAKLSPSVPLIINHDSGIGSGILLEFAGRMYVLTNRHVVAGMGKRGITVRFLKENGEEKEARWDVGPTLAKVVAHHQTADLSLIDINGARKMLEEQYIRPVALAPRKHNPSVGEDVFAIGHPGGGKEILTRTLGNGIVSAVARKIERSNFLQVTVPLNPGNSGGPLFDYFGRVVGVNTMIIRKSQDRGGIALEALNFALEISHVHELLDLAKEGKSNEDTEPGKEDIAQAEAKMRNGLALVTQRGYKPLTGTLKDSTRSFVIPAGGKAQFEFDCLEATRLALVGGCSGAEDIDLCAIHSVSNKHLGLEEEVSDQPNLFFQNMDKGLVTIILYNPTNKVASAVISLHRK